MKMKPYALLAAALLAPLAAIAEPPSPPPEGGPWSEHGQAHMQKRVEEMHDQLKLTEAQQPAWDAWVNRVREARENRKEARPDFDTLKSMTAIQRMEKMLEFDKARQASLTAILAATKSLYVTLSPEQRKLFDDLAPFGARGPRPLHRGGQPGPR